MRVIWLLLLLLPGWVYAADGDSDLLYPEFVEVDEATAKVFQEAGCKANSIICGFPGNDVLYGSFTGTNRTEAIVLVGIPLDGGSYPPGALFAFVNEQWKQLGPFDSSYSSPMGKDCRKISSSKGNELLLCEDKIFAYSYDDKLDFEFPPDYTLWMLDFSKSPVQTTLFSTGRDDTNLPFCEDRHSQATYNLHDDFQTTVADTNEDGLPDITVTLRETEISPTQCTDKYGVMQLSGRPPTRHKLVWLFDGKTFTPTPETQVFLDSLQNQ